MQNYQCFILNQNTKALHGSSEYLTSSKIYPESTGTPVRKLPCMAEIRTYHKWILLASLSTSSRQQIKPEQLYNCMAH